VGARGLKAERPEGGGKLPGHFDPTSMPIRKQLKVFEALKRKGASSELPHAHVRVVIPLPSVTQEARERSPKPKLPPVLFIIDVAGHDRAAGFEWAPTCGSTAGLLWATAGSLMALN
jgi:hypothetical protein